MLIELTMFRLNDGVSNAQLLTADRAVQAELSPRKGFVRRTAASDEAGRWLVITLWGSSEDAEASACLAFAESGRSILRSPVRTVQPRVTPFLQLELSEPYCCTSTRWLSSGSATTASVGPPGTSKGSLTADPPSSTARAMEARRSRTWT